MYATEESLVKIFVYSIKEFYNKMKYHKISHRSYAIYFDVI